MEDLSKKISDLLSTPEGLEKIKNVMGMFMESQNQTPEETPPEAQSGVSEPQNLDVESDAVSRILPITNQTETLGFNLNNPAVISKLSSVFEVMNTKDDHRVKLLSSLRPFLGQKRSSKLDQAVKMLQISKLSNVMKK